MIATRRGKTHCDCFGTEAVRRLQGTVQECGDAVHGTV
jgi:hypothetical protein